MNATQLSCIKDVKFISEKNIGKKQPRYTFSGIAAGGQGALPPDSDLENRHAMNRPRDEQARYEWARYEQTTR